MKLCDIVQFHSPLSGGVKRYVQDKSRYLARRPGMRHVMVVPAARNAVREEDGARVYQIRSPRIPGSKSYRFLVSVGAMEAIIAREKPDLIEVGDPYLAAWAACRIGVLHGIPVVAFYHSDYPRAMERSLRKCAGATVATAMAWPIRRYLLALYRRMGATLAASRRTVEILESLRVPRVIHTPLGVDTDRFYICQNREEIRRRLGVAPAERLALYVGRLAREKHISQLVGLMNEWPEEDPCLRLLLVGDGECAGLVERACRKDARIQWHPYCADAHRLAEYYSAADVFVHAGTTETFGLASLEAQACGLRVVAVRGGGLEETLEGEDPLVMAESATPFALATAIRLALAIPEDAETRARRRERIRSRFGHQQAFDRLLTVYNAVVAQRQSVVARDERHNEYERRLSHKTLCAR